MKTIMYINECDTMVLCKTCEGYMKLLHTETDDQTYNSLMKNINKWKEESAY